MTNALHTNARAADDAHAVQARMAEAQHRAASTSSDRCGVGLEFGQLSSGTLVVRKNVPGSPAALCGHIEAGGVRAVFRVIAQRAAATGALATMMDLSVCLSVCPSLSLSSCVCMIACAGNLCEYVGECFNNDWIVVYLQTSCSKSIGKR